MKSPRSKQQIKRDVLRFQARASRTHGIPREEFLKLTPREFNFIEIDYRKEEDARDYIWDSRFASLMHIVYAMNASSKAKKLTPQDFMPKRRQKKDNKPKSAESLLAGLAQFEAMERLSQEKTKQEQKVDNEARKKK